MENFALNQEFIPLCTLLKASGIAQSGAEGGMLIAKGIVKVDGVVERRKRRKIRAGQVVVVGSEQIVVVPDPSAP
jgi:ribosome-associated protein